MMRNAILIVALASALAGCNSPGAPPAETPPPVVEGELVLAPTANALAAGLVGKQFDMSELRELWVRVKVPQLAHVTTVKFVFIDPMGQPFYEDNMAFSVNPTMQTMDPGSGSVALNVHAATVVPGGYALDRPIAIAGSIFQRTPRYGSWVVEATVGGLSTKLTAPLEFISPRR